MSHNLSANLRCGLIYQDYLFVIFRWLLLMCPEGRTLLPRIPLGPKARNQHNSLLDGTWQVGDWAKILFRISRESATKGDVMNGGKESPERISFLLLARSLASL